MIEFIEILVDNKVNKIIPWAAVAYIDFNAAPKKGLTAVHIILNTTTAQVGITSTCCSAPVRLEYYGEQAEQIRADWLLCDVVADAVFTIHLASLASPSDRKYPVSVDEKGNKETAVNRFTLTSDLKKENGR
jgi:hypothetical protein